MPELPTLPVADADRRIFAGAGEQCAIRAKGHPIHSCGMTLICPYRLAVVGTPQEDRAILASSCNQRTIRAVGHRVNEPKRLRENCATQIGLREIDIVNRSFAQKGLPDGAFGKVIAGHIHV